MLHVKTDYLRKVIMQDRSSIYTKVGEIMTNKVSAFGLEDLIAISSFDYEIWFIL